MKLFEINYWKLAALALPPFLRKPVILSLFRVIAEELEQETRGVYSCFTGNRNKNLSDLGYNSQVCYLRAALNNYFKAEIGGDEKKEFRIESRYLPGDWIFVLKEESENEENKLILKRESAFATGSNHLFLYDMTKVLNASNRFVVYHPAFITGDMESQMHELVDRYRLASRYPKYEPF